METGDLSNLYIVLLVREGPPTLLHVALLSPVAGSWRVVGLLLPSAARPPLGLSLSGHLLPCGLGVGRRRLLLLLNSVHIVARLIEVLVSIVGHCLP